MSINKGLPTTFQMVKGKFQMLDGSEKATDNLRMLLAFNSFFRVYYQDFVPEILWLLQKPTSMFNIYRTIILGGLVTIFQKYLTFIQVQNINLIFDYSDRKSMGLDVVYKFKQPVSQDIVRTVQIINV